MAKTTSLFEKFKATGKHGIVYGIGAILEKALAFLLFPLYTTRLTTADYGILGLVTITGSVITTIFIIGMNYGLLRSYYDYKDEEKKKAVISTAFYILLVSSLILLVIGVFSARRLSIILFDSPEYRIHFLLIVITSFFQVLNTIPYIVFRVKMKSLQFILFQIGFLATGIGVIIYLVNNRGWGVLGALTGNLVMAAISCISLYIYIRREIVFRIIRYEIKKMLLMGSPLIPANLSVFVFTAIDRYFLNYYRTTGEVGIYNLAYNFGNIMTVLIATPISLIWPAMYLSVKEHDNAKEFYSRTLTYVLSISLFLFLGLSLLSKEILQIFSDREFWDAYLVIPLIVFTYAIWSTRKILNVAITIYRKTQATAVIEFTGAAVNIGLNFLLIPRYGIFGAAYATLITYIIVTMAMFFYNQKLMKLYYEWPRIIKLLLATAIIFSAGYFINTGSITVTIVVKLIIILIFPLLLWLFRFFTDGEKEKSREYFVKILNKVKTYIIRK